MLRHPIAGSSSGVFGYFSDLCCSEFNSIRGVCVLCCYFLEGQLLLQFYVVSAGQFLMPTKLLDSLLSFNWYCLCLSFFFAD